MIDFEGYVLYNKVNNKQSPFGVVSDDFECKAISYCIPSKIKRFLVDIEDKRFYNHYGLDPRGVGRALFENIKAAKIVQGGSSITQQLARNILRDNRKTISRKLKEVIKTFEIELRYSKEEILVQYFDNVYFGRNIRGIRAAALHYFEKETERLTESELLSLLTILRGPNYYINSANNFYARYYLLNNTLFDHEIISKRQQLRNSQTSIVFGNNKLHKIKSSVIPFIADVINEKKKIVHTTINNNVQLFADKYVSNSKYPVSIIVIKKKKVVAFASTYGTDYPFVSKSNVGSTFKPFLYCHLIDNGVGEFEEFNAKSNKLNWKVREATNSRPYLNITEALFCSNNNAFINACTKLEIDSSLQHLASVFKKNINTFFPSSILGATREGISLYELGNAYSVFFAPASLTATKRKCLSILNRVAKHKLGRSFENAFLKTGTTNGNRERFAILGDPDITFAILRNENPVNDDSKEGSFLGELSSSFSSLFTSKKTYTWI